jgi:hypothetical protein
MMAARPAAATLSRAAGKLSSALPVRCVLYSAPICKSGARKGKKGTRIGFDFSSQVIDFN